MSFFSPLRAALNVFRVSYLNPEKIAPPMANAVYVVHGAQKRTVPGIIVTSVVSASVFKFYNSLSSLDHHIAVDRLERLRACRITRVEHYRDTDLDWPGLAHERLVVYMVGPSGTEPNPEENRRIVRLDRYADANPVNPSKGSNKSSVTHLASSIHFHA